MVPCRASSPHPSPLTNRLHPKITMAHKKPFAYYTPPAPQAFYIIQKETQSYLTLALEGESVGLRFMPYDAENQHQQWVLNDYSSTNPVIEYRSLVCKMFPLYMIGLDET